MESAYSYVHDVVTFLVAEGFVDYRGRSGGVVLVDPRGLLLALRERGEPPAAVESFNVRSTTVEALRHGAEVLEAKGVRYAFSLGSALEEQERFVSSLPHGLYCSAGTELLTEAFSLRRQTPANFHVLRPRPAVDSVAGGVFEGLRQLPWGQAVATPQLVVDLAHAGGRGKEQSDHLLEAWVKTLPLQETE